MTDFSVSYLEGDSKDDRVTHNLKREDYARLMAEFEKVGTFHILGNLITKADLPKFRAIQRREVMLPLAEGVFLRNPEEQMFYSKTLSLHGKWLRTHGDKPLYPSLIWYVRDFVHQTMHSSYRWNAELVFELLEAGYEHLQKYNEPNIRDERESFPDGSFRTVAPILKREFSGSTDMVKTKFRHSMKSA